METPLTPAQELEIAQRLLEQGNVQHGVEHIARTLAYDAQNAEALALLDKVVAEHLSPAELMEWEKQDLQYYMAATIAYILIKYQQANDAFNVMRILYESIEGFPFLSWLATWAEDHKIVAQVNPDIVQRLLGQFEMREAKPISPSDRELFYKFLTRLATFTRANPPYVFSTMIISKVLRKRGYLDEALELALVAHKTSPQHWTAIVLNMAYYEKSQLDQAIIFLREALTFKPEDANVRTDLASRLCESGQLEEGLRVYQEALAQVPQHPWALPAFLYYKNIADPDGSWYRQLTDYVIAHPDNQFAVGRYYDISTYFTDLPEPGESVIAVAKKTLAKDHTIELATLFVCTMIESPSAIRSVQLIQLQEYGKTTFALGMAEVQQPDPRVPSGPVDFVLWKYDGFKAEPNLPEPSEAVATLVGRLAASFYDTHGWWLRAKWLLLSLPSQPDILDDLLGTMLYPPPCPPEFTTWAWLQRVQIAAAFMIARLDEGWENSVRRKALLSLARGPMDWTIGAAILVLCRIYRETGLGHDEIAALYTDLLSNLPNTEVPYDSVLITCAYQISPSPELKELATATSNYRYPPNLPDA